MVSFRSQAFRGGCVWLGLTLDEGCFGGVNPTITQPQGARVESQADKDSLVRGVGTAGGKFVGLAVETAARGKGMSGLVLTTEKGAFGLGLTAAGAAFGGNTTGEGFGLVYEIDK
ncbi:hypothetical protein Tco_0643910 [Tanacetum coccineum]